MSSYRCSGPSSPHLLFFSRPWETRRGVPSRWAASAWLPSCSPIWPVQSRRRGSTNADRGGAQTRPTRCTRPCGRWPATCSTDRVERRRWEASTVHTRARAHVVSVPHQADEEPPPPPPLLPQPPRRGGCFPHPRPSPAPCHGYPLRPTMAGRLPRCGRARARADRSGTCTYRPATDAYFRTYGEQQRPTGWLSEATNNNTNTADDDECDPSHCYTVLWSAEFGAVLVHRAAATASGWFILPDASGEGMHAHACIRPHPASAMCPATRRPCTRSCSDGGPGSRRSCDRRTRRSPSSSRRLPSWPVKAQRTGFRKHWTGFISLRMLRLGSSGASCVDAPPPHCA